MKKINLMTILFMLGFIGIAAQNSLAQLPNPSQQETNQWRNKKICNDPWVSKAVYQLNASLKDAVTFDGSDGECDISQYNNGQWGSYEQLWQAVVKRRDDLRAANLKWDAYTIGTNGKTMFLLDGNNKVITSILSHNGSTLVGNDGASIQALLLKINEMVAAGGGNMVAAGGGNMVAAGGGNLMNILKANGVMPNMPPPNFQVALAKAMPSLISNMSAGIYKVGSRQLLGMEAKKVVKIGSNYYLVR